MAIIFRSDKVMVTIPAGTPTLPPIVQVMASDSFSGANGSMVDRVLPNDLGGTANLVWNTEGYQITSGTAEPTTLPGNRLSLDPGVSDYRVDFTHVDAQSGVLMTVNLRASTESRVAARIRVAVNKDSISLTEVAVDGSTTPVPVTSRAHSLQPGDVISVAARGEMDVQVAVWVNGEVLIPWTDVSASYPGRYVSFIAGGTMPGFRMDNFRISQIL